jgi:polysaccharide export outer membrane protein
MTAFWSAIANGAILSALLSLAVWLALRITPRHLLNAATRYAIWWIVLAITLSLPMLPRLSLMGSRQGKPVPAGFARPAALAVGPLSTPLLPLTPADSTSVEYAISLPLRIRTTPWLRLIFNLWIATSLLLLARVFISYAALYRRSARAIDAPPELTATVTGVIRRRIRFAISAEIAIPIATGPLRPTVLIPSTLLTMSADDLEQIALHEAAHLVRRDDYALFAQRVIEALFALHPVVRWLTRQIDLEREIACDDIVVGSTRYARTYADCLTRTVALCGGVRTSLAAANVADSRSHLSRRIELLVYRSRNVTAGLFRRQITLIGVVLVCAAGLLAKRPLMVEFAVPQDVNPVVAQSPAVPAQSALQTTPATPAITPKPALKARRPLLVAQAAKPADPPPARQPDLRPEYVLGANDVVQVTVFDETHVSGTYVIGPDGRMSMPLIGTFNAAGMTIPALQRMITEKLGPFIADPVVNVQLLRNNSKQYTVIGGVNKSGPFPLLRETTILDALAASGGLKDFANLKKIVLRRGTREYPFGYRDVLRGKHLEQNITLEDGDIIIVPDSAPSQEKKS